MSYSVHKEFHYNLYSLFAHFICVVVITLPKNSEAADNSSTIISKTEVADVVETSTESHTESSITLNCTISMNGSITTAENDTAQANATLVSPIVYFCKF